MDESKPKIKWVKPEDLVEALREEAGVAAGQDVEFEFVSPEFERPKDAPLPSSAPSTPEEWEELRSMSIQALKEMGLRAWNEPDLDGKVLMLFPGEWYRSIPAGYLVEDIFTPRESEETAGIRHVRRHEPEAFVPGETDDDIRFGCLSFGLRVRVDKEDEDGSE